MYTKDSLVGYINNCIAVGKIVAKNDIPEILHNISDIDIKNKLATSLEDTVRMNDFFVKVVNNMTVLVYCYPSHEEVDLGECIDIIGEYAFYNNSLINRISGEGVRLIGQSAFSNSTVCRVKFQNLLQLGQYIFFQCCYLEEAEFPAVHDVGFACFDNCRKLKDVIMSPESIEANAFANCSQLTDFDFSNAVAIGGHAFYDAPLNDIIAPKLLFVGRFAFNKCHFRNVYTPRILTDLV